MHALLIGHEGLSAVTAGFHDKFLGMAASTGCGHIGVIHARFGIGGRQQFVNAPVAVFAGGCLVLSRLNGLGVVAAIVGALLVCVALRACHFRRRYLVRLGLHALVTIHAGEHCS